MDARAVIALVVVLEQHLPVRGHLVTQRSHAIRRSRERIARETLRNALRVAPPAYARLGMRSARRCTKMKPPHSSTPTRCRRRASAGTSSAVDEGRRDQPAVERVRPGVVRTANRAAHDALAAEQPAAAMAAEVEMRVQPVVAANDDDALAGHVEHAICAGAVELARLGRRRTTGPRRSPRCSRAKNAASQYAARGREASKCDNFRRFHRLIYQMPKRTAGVRRIPSNKIGNLRLASHAG